jgi:hypothetical protein
MNSDLRAEIIKQGCDRLEVLLKKPAHLRKEYTTEITQLGFTLLRVFLGDINSIALSLEELVKKRD